MRYFGLFFILITVLFLYGCQNEAKNNDPKEPVDNSVQQSGESAQSTSVAERRAKMRASRNISVAPQSSGSGSAKPGARVLGVLGSGGKTNNLLIGRENFTDYNTEEYGRIYENEFHRVLNNPLSTFSIDVDVASYANVRRFINSSRIPPKDAVRIEEMINYFSYNYPVPEKNKPFSIYSEVSQCPWNKEHKLIHIGLKGKKIKNEKLPASNLVFLLDVSGSMSRHNKLPLLQKSFRLLVEQLRPQDKIAIVVYAGAAGLVLPSTDGSEKQKIIMAINELSAGGSTAGGAGINLAYKVAGENFIKGGNNRIILATDGDFNVGISSTSELVRLVEEKRKAGIYLTVLGFGMGNYKDDRMEQLADKGNGNYAYIDNILEAKKVLVSEMGGTLFTIAKDVKIQIEFNPNKIQAYKLIGYENRLLNAEDFNNDKKDAGELGSGHTVTALYEVIPVGVKADLPEIDDLKYQKTETKNISKHKDELLTVKFRYKAPEDTVSKLIVQTIKDSERSLDNTTDNFRFSAAVASFGMLLRDSKYINGYKYDDVVLMAQNARGTDQNGYRYEFVQLVEKIKLIKQ